MAKLVVNVPTCALNFCVRWADVDDVVLATFLLHYNQNSTKGDLPVHVRSFRYSERPLDSSIVAGKKGIQKTSLRDLVLSKRGHSLLLH